MKRYVPAPESASMYGFEWTGQRLRDNKLVPESRLVVQRTARIPRKNGKTRVLTVYAERGMVDIYVSPTGQIRVFRSSKELK